MTEKKYRVHDWVKFQYSEIGEYIDENHTDKPLRNDEICDLLNEQHKTIKRLKQNINELLSVDIEEKLLKENIEWLEEENKALQKQNKKLHDDLHKINQIVRGY